MKLWRITHKDVQSPWRPAAKQNRWNSQASRITYATRCPALAVAEVLSYLYHVEELEDRLLHEAEWPHEAVENQDYPVSWNAWPHDPATQDVGDAWAKAGGSALLVRTAILPEGTNVLLNQLHEDFEDLEELGAHPLSRLGK